MKTFDATFLKRGKWWVAWSEDVPGALTQGRTLAEVRTNLRDAIRTMLAPLDLGDLPDKVNMRREKIRV
jgi:predicted RNase H-like HicB family nuclease